MKSTLGLTGALILSMMAATPAFANGNDDSNNWVVRFGVHSVTPKSDNGHLAGMKANVSSDLKPTVSLEYMIDPSWGIELLAAIPFEHDVQLNGHKAVATKELPPVLGLNYHFMPHARVSPFLGAGVNYTRFFDTDGKGPLEGSTVKIDNSWGVAAHAGVDVRIAPKWLFTADLRWIDIKSDVHVNGSKVGTATINPFAVGLSLGYRF